MKQHIENTVLTAEMFDHRGNLLPAVTLDLFQTMANHHAERLNIGFETMLAKNLLWVVTQVYYQVEKVPQPGQTVTLTTWPLPPTRLGFDREYLICDEAGEVLIRGTSKWMLIDAVKRKPVIDVSVYPLSEYCTTKNFEGRIRRIRDFETTSRIVRLCPNESTIDKNHHVNNAEYAGFVYRAMQDFGGSIRTFQIDFLHEVLCGEPLDVSYTASGNTTLIKGVGEDGTRKFACGIEIQ